VLRFDAENPEHILELRTHIRQSLQEQQPFVDFHHWAVEQDAGSLYGGNEEEPETLFPEVSLLIDTLRAELATNPPQGAVRTYDRIYQKAGVKLEMALNNELRADKDSFQALQAAINSSFYTLGVLHVGVANIGMAEVYGQPIYETAPYFEHIPLEDYFHDMNASRIEKGEYQGHFYYINLERAKDNPNFIKEARERLTPDGEEREATDYARLHDIGGIVGPRDKSLHDMVTLMNVWIPEEKLLLVLPNNATKPGDVLQIVEWDGSKHGPYIYLGFKWMDGNTMPKSLFMELAPIHVSVNNVGRKVKDSIEAFKRIGLVPGAADTQDAKNIMKTQHGDVTGVENPGAIVEQTYGGVDAGSLTVLQMLQERFSYYGGNLDVLGGLKSQAETLGQEQILQQQSSGKLNHMRNEVNRFVQQAISDYALWMWKSQQPFNVTYSIGDFEIPVEFSKDERSHDFFAHTIEVVPYSMAMRTPQQKFVELMTVLDRLMPYWPMFQAQGATINAKEFLRLAAKELDKPELVDLIQFGQPPENYETAESPPRMQSPPTTNRIQTRISGRANDSPSSQMAMQMMRGGQK